jgi:hypothetical protein
MIKTSPIKGDFRYREYRYLVPVYESPNPNEGRYVGMSLKEIREKYSDKEALMVYQTAAEDFGDMTKLSLKTTPLRTVEVFDWEYIDDDSFPVKFEFRLKANQYNNVGKDLLIAGGQRSGMGGEGEVNAIIDLIIKSLYWND